MLHSRPTSRLVSLLTVACLACAGVLSVAPAAVAAMPEWDAPTVRSTDGVAQGSSRPVLTAGADGRVVAVWITTAADGSSAPFELTAAVRSVGGTWGAPVVLDAGAANVGFQGIDFIAEHAGTYHVVWAAAGEIIHHASLPAGSSTWTAPTVVSDPGTTGRFPAAGIDSAGALQVAYMENDGGTRRVVWRRRGADGTWGAVELVADEDVYNPGPNIKLHVADDGTATTAWNGPDPANELRAAQRDAITQTWEAPTTITEARFGGTDFVLAGNGSGDVAIVGEGDDAGTIRRLVARRPDGGAWDGGSFITNSLEGGNFDAVVDSDGLVTVAWRQLNGGVGRVHVNYRAITGSSWLVGLQPITGPAENFSSTLRLQMAVDTEDQVTTTWVHSDGIHSIRGNAVSGWNVEGWRKLVADADARQFSLALDSDDQPHLLFQSGAAATSVLRSARWPIGPVSIESVIVPEQARVGDVVRLSVATRSPAPLADSGITWRFGDGTPVANGAAATHVWTRPGVYLVSVVVMGPTGTIASQTRTIQVGLAHVAPTVAQAPRVTGVAVAGRTLSCTAGTWNGTGPMEITPRWQVARGAGLFADAGIPLGTGYRIEASEQGARIRCVVIASNAGGQVELASEFVSVATAPGIARAPRVTGPLQVGRSVACNRGTWRGTAPFRFAYAWQQQVGRRWVPIRRATAVRLQLPASAAGRRVRCVVTARNIAGSASATSASKLVAVAARR